MSATNEKTGNSKLKPSKKATWLSIVVWSLSCVFYFYEFLLQVSPSVMGHDLMREFSIGAHSLGLLSGAYFYAYAGMQIPVGIMLDRYGPHKLLTIATLICGISSLLFGLTDHFYTAVVARFFIGIGSAFAAIGCMKLAANWFASERFGLLVGILVTIGMLGAISGESPLALLIHNVGWRESMIILGIIGIILALLIFIIVKDYPPHQSENHPHARKSGSSLWRDLLIVIRNKQLWLVASYGGLMYMATPTLCGLWGVPYLMSKFDVSRPKAAAIISTIFVGWVVASAFWGWVSDTMGRRLPPMIIGSLGALLTMSLILYVPSINILLMEVLLFLFGVFSGGFLPSFSIAKEICPDNYVATGLSFMNMMNMVGIAIAQPLLGKILDSLWSGQMEKGVRVYSVANYEFALSMLVIGIAISLILLPFIKETYCRPRGRI